jgi:signal transduction histidine kinase
VVPAPQTSRSNPPDDEGVRVLAWVLVALVAVADVTGSALRLATEPATASGTELSILRSVPAFLIATVVGALVVRRQAGNATGWVLIGTGGAFSALLLLESWERAGLPAAVAAAWIVHWLWIFVFAQFALVLLLLPDGRPPSPWWGVVGGMLAVGAVALAVTFALAPGPLDDRRPRMLNPLAAPPAWEPVLGAVGTVAGALLLGGMLLCAVSLVVRYRRGDAVLRQQLKWVALAGVPALVVTVLHSTVGQSPALNPYTLVLADLGFLALFAAIGVAVLRHRLFDVDLVINRAVVYGLLALFVAAVYVAVVVLVGRWVGGDRETELTVLATALVALGVAPVRERAGALANRWVYGERRSPYELLTDLGRRLSGALSPDDLLPGIAQSVAGGVGAAAAEVRLHLPGGHERRASWPDDGPLPRDPARVVPVVAGTEEVGDIAVLPRPGFPLTRGQRRLVDDLARQAALAMSNARLTAQLADQLARVSEHADQLRASRQRLVAAQDEERRRLERDIHDGAQQQLVAVTLQLRAAAGKVPAEVAPLLEQVREQVTETISTLRTLARGVFPPLLAEAGLAAAVRAHIGKTRLPIHLDDRTSGRRFAPEIEAALYFCCLEALQNATKHAGSAATVSVLLDVSPDRVCVEVSDDGPGFDPAAAGTGAGLVHMADRLAAVDGELQIVGALGGGAAVRCSVRLPTASRV